MVVQSALENVIGKVVEEARQEILKVLEAGKAEAEEILHQAQRESELEAGKIISSTDRQVESLTRRIIGSAELEARNRSLRLIEDNMNKVFGSALEKLRKDKPQKGYEEAMRKIVEEAVDSVGAEKVILWCNQEDRSLIGSLARQTAKAKGIEVSVSDKPIQCVGGVKASTADGSISYDNTFEARLNRMRPVLRKAVAEYFSK